tara:strand:- start:1361 stop:2092 length:732 start_codon:yes stop_codon:yes gene_type:complete
MRDITLSIKRGAFRGDSPDPVESIADYKLIRPQVLERDIKQCQFCDFHADKYQEVHHLDDNHENNAIDNLATACSLCHMCFHIGFAGIKQRGVLIYCEEGRHIPHFQARLNNLVRVLWACTSSSNKKLAVNATDYLKRLENMRTGASEYIGTSDPIFLGNYLSDLEEEEYEKRKDVLDGIFLLPLREGYPDRVKYWTKTINKNGVIDKLEQLAKTQSLDWIGIEGKKKTLSGLKSFLDNSDIL